MRQGTLGEHVCNTRWDRLAKLNFGGSNGIDFFFLNLSGLLGQCYFVTKERISSCDKFVLIANLAGMVFLELPDQWQLIGISDLWDPLGHDSDQF